MNINVMMQLMLSHLFQQKIVEKENAVQIPLFFSDGTFVDKAGRHYFEPCMFTLGIFKQIAIEKSGCN